MSHTATGFAAAALAATESLVTPVAVADERMVEANLARMAGFAAKAGLQLRPHAKTHKSAFIAGRQVAHGAAGVTAATLREAEVFSAAGVSDILIAHPPAGEPKHRRLAALAERVPRLAVALDDLGLAGGLPEAVEVMWEVDCGLNRVGTLPGEPTAKAVRDLVRRNAPGRFRGLMTHVRGHPRDRPRPRPGATPW